MWDECLEVGENGETHGRIGMRELTLRIQVTNKYQYEEASLGSVVEEIGHEVVEEIGHEVVVEIGHEVEEIEHEVVEEIGHEVVEEIGHEVEEIEHEVAQDISLSIHLILYMVGLFGILVLYS
jgi:hypothetical protein